MNFLAIYWPELGIKLWEQITLVGLSTLFAIIIGVTIGSIFFKRPKISHIIINITAIIQTIPSLALLTFLLPLFGIGIKPALIALVLYALLPIVCNTLTGLQNVSPELKRAAENLGFTPWQQLRWVEFPLALPIILTGIKTALIINVGVATLAAFIGAGGLGDFINRGLALSNNQLVLLGAIPAALLALILNGLFSALVNTLTSHELPRKNRGIKLLGIIFIFSGLLFSAWRWSLEESKNSTFNPKNIVRLATKNFSESILLGEIIAQTIEAKTSLQVKKYFNLGSTEICQQALLKNKIDLYPEYTGTSYLIVLHGKKALPKKELFDYLNNYYQKHFNLTWIIPFGFNNTQALAIQNNFAQKNNLTKISDLVSLEKQLVAGVLSEFLGRPDGIPGLKRIYGLEFGQVHEMAPSLMYPAIEQNQVDVISAFSTDGHLQHARLTLLDDDKHLFPPYDAAIVIREDILKQRPEIRTALEPLAGLIHNKEMQELNYQVDIQKIPPKKVASAFLKKVGVIS